MAAAAPEPEPDLKCPDCGAGPFNNGRALHAHKVGAHMRAARRAGGGKADVDLGAIQQSITDALARVGMYATLAFPLAGTVLMARAERAAASICTIARTNPALMRVLKMMTTTTVYAELGFVLGDVVIALGVERGVIPIDSVLTHGIRDELRAVLAAQEQQEAERPDGVDLADETAAAV